MKKIMVLVVLAAVVYVGASYVLGGQVRDRYFSELEARGGGVVALSNQSYERGVFSSGAVTLVEVTEPGGPDGEPARTSRIAVRHVFHHGPFPASGAGATPMLALVDSTVEPVAQGGPLGEIFTQVPELSRTTSTVSIGFDGGVEGELLVPAFEVRRDGESFSWRGLTVKAVQDPGTGALRGEYAAPGLTGTFAEGMLAMEGFSGRFDVVEALPLVFVGKVEGSLETLNATSAGEGPVTLGGLRFISDSGIEGNMIRYRQTISVERGTAGGIDWGPAVCDMETVNVDAAALSEFQTEFRKLYGSAQDADGERTAELYTRLFEKLLAGTPEFRVHSLKVPTSMGDMESTLHVRLDPPGEAVSANLLTLLRRIDATAEMAVDESLLVGLVRSSLEGTAAGGGSADGAGLDALARQTVDAELDPLLARNLIMRDGGKIRTRAVLKQGLLKVNGQETPLF